MAKRKIHVDIVVPIYNEEIELEKNISRLHRYLTDCLSMYSWRIIIADNASTDQSAKIGKKITRIYPGVEYFYTSKRGRGNAVKLAWMGSNADIVSYLDIDLSTELNHFSHLVKAIENGYDLAVGSRLLPMSRVINRPLKREILSRMYNFLMHLLFATKFSDAQCGFKAISGTAARALLPSVIDNEWFFDSELLILAEKYGFKIFDEPVLWIDNPGSTVRVLKTVTGDLRGLIRLWLTKPWRQLKNGLE